MNVIRKIVENTSANLIIELPEAYQNRKIEVIILPLEEEQSPDKDLSRFFGKLNWKGDAVAEQRKLRNEWD